MKELLAYILMLPLVLMLIGGLVLFIVETIDVTMFDPIELFIELLPFIALVMFACGLLLL